MRSISSRQIAWFLCALILLSAIFGSVFELHARPAGDTIFHLAADIITYLAHIIFAITGALVVSRQAKNKVGWLLILEGLLVFTSPLARYINNLEAAPANPSSLMLVAIWINSWISALMLFPLLYIALLFPTGKPPTPRWQWLMKTGYGILFVVIFLASFTETFEPVGVLWSVANPVGFLPPGAFPFGLYAVVMIIFSTICILSLFVRYHQASHQEQHQLKWLLFAGSFLMLNLLLGIWWSEQDANWAAFGQALLFLAILMIPVSVAIAILRYRLYDIDLIIRKTLQYSILTGLLTLVFFGGVVIPQEIFRPIKDSSESPLVTVVTTLGIAALFNPLRLRVQGFIDRRFYRKKYDAEQALAQFAATARDEVDMNRLATALVNVVEETMQPEEIKLWIK